MAQAVAGVLEHGGVKAAHVVGLSVSGMIAQTLAIKHPNLVDSLTLVSTRSMFPVVGRQAMLELAEMARETLLLQDKDFHASMWEMISTFDVTSQLHNIKCPTMVVIGAADLQANQEAGRELAGKIPGAIRHEISDAGHLPPVQTPVQFNTLLRSFLAS